MERTRSADAVWKLVAALCALCWGASFYFMKEGAEAVSPSWLIAIRFIPASLMMGAVVRSRLDPRAPEFIHGAAMGFISWTSYLALIWGLTLTTASKGSFLGSIYCVMVPFVAWASGARRPRLTSIVAAFVCATGLLFVSRSEDLSFGAGDGLCILSALLVAIQISYISRKCSDDDVMAFSFWEFAFTGAFALVYALVFDELPGDQALEPQNLAMWAFLSIVCSFVAFAAYNTALTRIDPSAAGLLGSLEGPSGVAVALLLGDDRLTPKLTLGFVLIMVAIVISELGQAADVAT